MAAHSNRGTFLRLVLALRGEVMAGDADWQLRRPDGVTEVLAVYSISKR